MNQTSGGYSIVSGKDTSGVLTWQWLGGLTLGLLIMAGGFVYSTVDKRITSNENRLVTMVAAQQLSALRENSTTNAIERINDRQERSNKLLLQIAKKMGIEVAE